MSDEKPQKSTNSRNSGNFNLLISWTKENNGIEIKKLKDFIKNKTCGNEESMLDFFHH